MRKRGSSGVGRDGSFMCLKRMQGRWTGWSILEDARPKRVPGWGGETQQQEACAGVRAAGSSPNTRKMLQHVVSGDLIFSDCILIFQCRYF